MLSSLYFIIKWVKNIYESNDLNDCNVYESKPLKNKRTMGLNGHLSIRDSTPTSCHQVSYLHINSPIIE